MPPSRVLPALVSRNAPEFTASIAVVEHPGTVADVFELAVRHAALVPAGAVGLMYPETLEPVKLSCTKRVCAPATADAETTGVTPSATIPAAAAAMTRVRARVNPRRALCEGER
jgi:hypothetical protein